MSSSAAAPSTTPTPAPTPTPTRASLDAVPWVDVAGNLRAATLAGRRFSGMMREVLALWHGPGRLTMAEYFYYRLWDSPLPLDEKRRFVDKRAQHTMHLACNDPGWHGVTQDKLLFHAAALGAGLPVPRLLAVTHPTRGLPGVPSLRDAEQVARVLRDPALYPLFAKPIGGIYSLGAISVDHVDAHGRAYLVGTADRPVSELAAEIAGVEGGMLVQQRLAPDTAMASRFGGQLCSVRLFVLLTGHDPVITRAICKIPAPDNPADNFWRPGNMLAAVDLDSGTVTRVVRGTGQEMELDFEHPKTGQPIVGARVAWWADVVSLARRAALVFPGVRTQSWDVAVTNRGPVLLEVNWGGDLNLAQLAHGRGILDETYAGHLRANRYDRRGDERRLAGLRAAMRRA